MSMYGHFTRKTLGVRPKSTQHGAQGPGGTTLRGTFIPSDPPEEALES